MKTKKKYIIPKSEAIEMTSPGLLDDGESRNNKTGQIKQVDQLPEGVFVIAKHNNYWDDDEEDQENEDKKDSSIW